MLGGNFNTDALINSTAKRGSTIYDMLMDPVKFPLIAARKEEVLNEYKNMLVILDAMGGFKVTDTVFMKDNIHKPTYDVCRFRQGEWVPTEIFYTEVASECSNQVLDYMF
jgi:hypothetical protein